MKCAAICSSVVVTIYEGLEVLEENIQDGTGQWFVLDVVGVADLVHRKLHSLLHPFTWPGRSSSEGMSSINKEHGSATTSDSSW
jgi:hypothetical protein